jgi:hypothetical protein
VIIFTGESLWVESMTQPRGLSRPRGLHREQEDDGRAKLDGGVERERHEKTCATK